MMRILSDRGLRNPNPSHAMVAVEDRGLRSGNATPMVLPLSMYMIAVGTYTAGRESFCSTGLLSLTTIDSLFAVR